MVENELLIIILILLFICFQLYEKTGFRKLPMMDSESVRTVKSKIMKPFAKRSEKIKPKINDDAQAWKNENNLN